MFKQKYQILLSIIMLLRLSNESYKPKYPATKPTTTLNTTKNSFSGAKT